MYGTEFGPLADAPFAPSYTSRDEMTRAEADYDAWKDEQEWNALSDDERNRIEAEQRANRVIVPDPFEDPNAVWGPAPF